MYLQVLAAKWPYIYERFVCFLFLQIRFCRSQNMLICDNQAFHTTILTPDRNMNLAPRFSQQLSRILVSTMSACIEQKHTC